MFKFLKDKIKGAIDTFSKNVDDEAETIEEKFEEESIEKEEPQVEEPQVEPEEDAEEEPEELVDEEDDSEEEPEEEAVEEKEELVEDIKEEKKELVELKEDLEITKEKLDDQKIAVQEEKKGFFSKIKQKVTTKKISAEQFDKLFWDLEIVLLENNVAVEVIEKIKEDLKLELVDKPISRGKIESTVFNSLRNSINELFLEPVDIVEAAKEKKPFVIAFVGINGSGKTTSIAKVAKMFKDSGKSVVLAAADTFRAAAIDQLQTHADNIGVKMIKHDYGSDAAAVAFDAVKHAEATKKDIVLIDTAGRLHSNSNLMDELSKIVRVAKPDMKIFVGESITGNDCIEQAQKFDEVVGIDGIILSKADIDEKGGASISVSYVTKKPVLYIGIGQEYEDIQLFDKKTVIDNLGL